MSTQDFFFGNIADGFGGATTLLDEMGPLARKVSAEFFTAQLNRILNEHGGRLTLYDGTSYPCFWNFIDKVAAEQVGFIELYARQDVNDLVEATLSCDIALVNGLITVKPHWCAYKEIRANEIVSTLLVPLYLKALQDKAFIRWDDGKTERLDQGNSHQTELEKVFKLAKYPYAMFSGDDADKNANRHSRDLRCASDVAQRGLSSDQAWNAYQELRNSRAM